MHKNYFAYIVIVFISKLTRLLLFFEKKRKHDVVFLIHDNPYSNKKLDFIAESFGDFAIKILNDNKLSMLKLVMLGKPALVSKNRMQEELRLSYARGLRYFNSKVIVQFSDSDILSSYVKKHSGSTLVNIAHCVTGSTRFFSQINFHYYFIFGDSSIDNLNKNNYLVSGSTTLIKTGPLFCEFDFGYKLSSYLSEESTSNKWSRKILFSSQYTNILEVQDLFDRNNAELLEYARNNPNELILVTLHPMEPKINFWSRATSLNNLLILPSGISKNELSKFCDVHITLSSSSTIDYALRGLNTVILRTTKYADEYLSFSKYFDVTINAKELGEILKKGQNKNRLNEFLNYHCEYTDFKSLSRVVDSITKIIEGKDLSGIHFSA